MPPPSSPTRGSTRSSSPPTVSTVPARHNNIASHPSSTSIEQHELTISLENSATHSAYLSALRQIDRIPVPDLASTLTNPAEDEVNEVNLSFLRTPIEPREHSRTPDLLEQHRQRINRMSDSWSRSAGDDRGRRERLERVLAQLNRMHGNTQEGRAHDPLHERPSPGQHSDGEDDREIMAAISRLREIYPNTPGEVLRVMAQHQLERQREHRQRYVSQTDPSLRSQSDVLRSSAILQAVRRHPRFSPRSREYFGERTREHQPERGSLDHSIQTEYYDRRLNTGQTTPDSSGYSASRIRPRARRMVLSESEPASAINNLLQESILYLAKLRSSCSYEDGVSQALRAGFNYKDFIDQTFVLDLNSIPPPAPTSLLAPGAMFTGSQHANTPSPEYLAESSMVGLQYLPMDNSLAPTSGPPAGYVPWDARRQSTSSYDFSSGQFHAQSVSRIPTGTLVDHWPVKVTIFDVDYERMTLTASMEAYEVPSHPPSAHSPTSQCNPSSHQQKSITTYLEGEILDLRTHTFVTENFTSTIARDLTYWRKLPPFKSIPAGELPRRLLSRDFLTQISEQYVLMRWKERCFVQQSVRAGTGNDPAMGDSISEPDGCGLTISGFYYVSLRRRDGLVEGLYCDPASSPYQYLRLGRVKGGGFPAWSFK